MKTSTKLLLALYSLIALSVVGLTIAARASLYKFEPIDGNGEISEQLIPLEPFDGFSLNQSFDVHYLPGERYEVKVITDANLQEFFLAEMDGKWLNLSRLEDFGQATRLEVYVYAPQISGFSANNHSTIISDSLIQQEKFEVRANNHSEVRFYAVVDKLILRARANASITAKGACEDLNIDVNSASKIDAIDLNSQFADIEANGAANVRLWVNHRLRSNVNGGAKVLYQGPESLTVKATGRFETLPLGKTESLP